MIEPMGHLWAAFSPATGETALLNDESAAILEVLEAGPAGTAEVCASLSVDSGLGAKDLFETVHAAWPRLIESGLVCEQALRHVNAR